MQQDGQPVCFMAVNRKVAKWFAKDSRQPNGIVGTPDGKLRLRHRPRLPQRVQQGPAEEEPAVEDSERFD